MKYLFLIFSIVIAYSCSTPNETENKNSQDSVLRTDGILIDKNATAQTQALYRNLKLISKTKTLFGHQDDLAYGVNWWAEEERSDVKDVSGSYPAVFGWDVCGIGTERNIDSILFTDMKRWMEFAYNAGGINTVSWHMQNPVSKTHSWDTIKALHTILPNGKNHQFFVQQLTLVGNFLKNLTGKNGEAVPVIFRPWHEHSGNWFWWGEGHRTEEEYVQLFRFTVEYLRDSLNVHNLIYAYSPDGQHDTYMKGYPSDEYVDILGLDFYSRNELNDKAVSDFEKKLENLCLLANQKGKLAALTETGREGVTPEDWFTRFLLTPLKNNAKAAEIAYILVWRNANTKHFFAPYKGHTSVPDFLKFKADSSIVFLDNLPSMYK